MKEFKHSSREQLLEEIERLRVDNTELTNKKEFSQIVADNTSDIITISSFNLKVAYLYVSPSMKQTMGYEPKYMIGKSFFDFVHPDDKKNILVLLKKYLRDILKKIVKIDGPQINESIEYRLKDKSGNWRYTQSTINFYGNKLLAISRDITEQKKSQKALLLSEDKFRVLYNNSPDMYVSVSPKDACIIQCNETLLIETGYSKEEIIGKKVFEIYHNDCISDAKEAFKQFVETGTVKDKELILRKKDGSKIFVSLNVNAVRDKSGEITQSISTWRNITQRKILEDALHKSEATVKNILNTIDDIVYVFDKENRFVLVNKSNKELFLPKEKFLGKTISDVMSPNVAKLFMASLPKVKSGKTASYEYQLEMPDGLQWFAVKISGLFDNDKYLGMVAISRNITTRKQNEEKLSNSEEEHRLIFDGANDGIILVDKNLKVINVNPAFSEIINIPKENIIGKSSFKLARKFVGIKQLPQVLNYANSILKKSNSITYNLDYQDKILEISAGRQKSGNVVGIIRDITERKKAEKLLKKSENLYHTLFESANDAIFIMSGEMFIDCNEKTLTMFGARMDEIIGHSPIEFSPPIQLDGRGSGEKALEKINATIKGKPQFFEWQHKKKDGTIFNAEVSLNLIELENGAHIQAIVRDITARKITEQSLKESQTRFKVLSEATNEAILIIEDGIIIEVNSAAINMSGYSYNEFIKSNAIDFIAEESKELVKNNMISGYEKTYDAIAQRKDGSKFHVELQGRTVIYKGKEVRISAVRDITERKKAEEAIYQQNIELQKSNEELDAFSHTVAHDLKNPLGTILGFAELLLNNYSTSSHDEIHRDLNAIIKSGGKTQEIINSLLLLASVRQSEIQTTELNMADIVKEAIHRLNPLIKKSNATIVVEGTWPTVLGYAIWIEEVWVNYLSNAIKYGGFPPHIVIGADKTLNENTKEEMVRFWVKDNGPGVSAENQRLLFNKFERFDQVKTEGYGLGLSIVRSIINKLNGKVGMDNKTDVHKKNQGSLFYFTLPIAPNTIKKIKKDIPEFKNHVIAKKLKVLIAEDEKTSDVLLTIIINDISKETLHAKTGIETIELCRNNPDIDLILMDIKMPRMDGYEATREIRKFNKEVIIIAQTAFALMGDREEAIAAGCDDYITKPIDKDELINMIKSFVST